MISPALADYIAQFKKLAHCELPAVKIDAVLPKVNERPTRMDSQLCALVLSPHPDDECLMGGLPLRLSQEDNWQIINVAITLGSKLELRKERLNELAQACAIVGFDLLLPTTEAFTSVRRETKEKKPEAWAVLVGKLASIIRDYWPEAIIIPHARDLHYTHIGTHLLALDALASMPSEFSCHLVQSEYWHPNETPNLMVGLSEKDVATLFTGLCCHESQNKRLAFNQFFPGYLSDNVRRGSERVWGEGASQSPMDFAMLYRLDLWKDRKIIKIDKKFIYPPDQKIRLDPATIPG